ncbi:MAG: group II intron reverse transcriptase/maturase [Chloroflexota bacterium]|nr:group II intron reverse transcriptase/maturase [Chloroflexota bacterium]
MEQAVARENMWAALRRVEQNKGAPGVDGLHVEDLREHLKANWEATRAALLDGSYEPKPVRRVEIPKPGGGKRLLGIPTVVDRLIQQALLQVLTPLFDPGFSAHSYGFRPGRSAHDAVEAAREHIEAGYDWVVDLDLAQFFDRVQHDKLMARVARKVEDKRVLRLIRRYLQAGVMINGVCVATEEGTPQGGPLSPLLGNIMLDDLDRELTARGHRFCRYADDCNVYVRSRKAGERVMGSIRRFVQGRLGLQVNEQKSAVDRPWSLKFLGFSFYRNRGIRIRLAPKTLERFKARVRGVTARSNGRGMEWRIRELDAYQRGWLGYFALAATPSVYRDLDGWVRRRLRACLWKQWKRVRTRQRELRALGLPEWQAQSWARTRKGYWRMACGPLNRALDTAYWRRQGLQSLTERYGALYAP